MSPHVVVPSEVRIDKQVERIEFDNAQAVFQRLFHPSLGGQQVRVPVVSVGVIGIQINGPLKRGLGAAPVPLIVEMTIATGGVCFREIGIQLECPTGSGLAPFQCDRRLQNAGFPCA